MLRRSCLAMMLALTVAGCSNNDSTTTTPAPTNVQPKFTATLAPTNEVPPVTNADATGSGTATITLTTTKDAAGNVTAATADFVVNLSGFPANTTLTGAHIHQAAAGANGSIVVNTTLANGAVVLTSGSTSFERLTITVTDPTIAQAIINNPANFYFNVHTTANTGGAVRGQLVRVN